MAFPETLTNLITSPTALSITTLILLLTLYKTALAPPRLPPNIPTPTKETYPLLGALAWFTERWDFHQRASQASATGNFTFFAGPHAIISVASDEARRVFFESKHLDFNGGYQPLLAGATQSPDGGDASQGTDFNWYFRRRLAQLLKREQLSKGLEKMMGDCREAFERLEGGMDGVTDPFESVYGLVHRLTMRTVACNDVADSLSTLKRTLGFFEMIERSGTPLTVMYSWLPTWGKLMRTYAGTRLYLIFKRVVDERKRTGRRDEDPMQMMIDSGDNMLEMLTLIIGSLFAGQLNSGVNAAWICVFLATNPEWQARVRQEVSSVAAKYCSDSCDLPLRERLTRIPIEAWETEFPMIDLCLKESIRLVSHGNGFRRNLSDQPVALDKIGKEVVPPGAFVTFATGAVHMDPEIYPQPEIWDPARYLPERAEDKKKQYAWMGWGHARHPCIGMRFAKLENTLIVAFWLAYFDFELVNKHGKTTNMHPKRDINEYAASKPLEKCWLKYTSRKD